MPKNIRKIFKYLTHRMVIVSFLILLQVAWFAIISIEFASYSEIISFLFRIISFCAVLTIIMRSDNPAVKIAWIVVILIFPVFGGLLYLYLGGKRPTRRMRRRLKVTLEESARYLVFDPEIEENLNKEDTTAAGQVHYLQKMSGFPACKHSKATYYPSGEECFEEMLKDLERAEDYIFLEYFIIEEGIMWNSVLDVLERKAKEGVDVRVMYDDVGTVFLLPFHYDRTLKEKGIQCVVFNRYIPIFSTVFNNRDHRKILVIDGKVAYTGGINFADEYINEKQRFGYWKDNGVRITGKAVHSMTMMFLQMWNTFAEDKVDYDRFSYEAIPEVNEPGLVLPYSDNPLDSELVGENVYLNLINNAVDYIYFFTPYLIIDNELITALILAAKRGVDVRIITPGIPDKKLVYLETQSYYQQLVEGGVQIFQYRPGFVHSKVAVCDDRFATVGTINLDYRSLYFHFENGVYLYDCPEIMNIKNDILETLEDCTNITIELCRKSVVSRFIQGCLRIFSPLL